MTGECAVCRCTDYQPCIEAETGEPCAWAKGERNLCSFCAELDTGMKAAITRGFLESDEDEPLVVPCKPYEAQRFIEQRRKAAGA